MAERESLITARPRMRVTFSFEYDPFVETGENLTPEQIANRDEEDMNTGDLSWDDLEGFEVDRLTVEPAP